MSIGVANLSQTDLLRELEPVVEENLERHIKVAKEWFPHEYVPWSEGRDFDGVLDGEAWDVEQSQMSDVARTAMIVNLLTEDNLPSYHHEIATVFGRDGAWGTWVHRWTAEEGRHGIAIRDYLLATRAVDPIELERARMTHMGAGLRVGQPRRPGALAGLRVVPGAGHPHLAPQHRQDHRRPALRPAALPHRAGREPAHGLLPQPARRGSLKLAPSQTMRAIAEVVKTFEMPGNTIENFTRKSVQIALAGVYDLRIHRDEVLAPVLRYWGVWDIEGLDDDGEKARQELADMLDGLDTAASRFEEKRDTHKAKILARGQTFEAVS